MYSNIVSGYSRTSYNQLNKYPSNNTDIKDIANQHNLDQLINEFNEGYDRFNKAKTIEQFEITYQELQKTNDNLSQINMQQGVKQDLYSHGQCSNRFSDVSDYDDLSDDVFSDRSASDDLPGYAFSDRSASDDLPRDFAVKFNEATKKFQNIKGFYDSLGPNFSEAIKNKLLKLYLQGRIKQDDINKDIGLAFYSFKNIPPENLNGVVPSLYQKGIVENFVWCRDIAPYNLVVQQQQNEDRMVRKGGNTAKHPMTIDDIKKSKSMLYDLNKSQNICNRFDDYEGVPNLDSFSGKLYELVQRNEFPFYGLLISGNHQMGLEIRKMPDGYFKMTFTDPNANIEDSIFNRSVLFNDLNNLQNIVITDFLSPLDINFYQLDTMPYKIIYYKDPGREFKSFSEMTLEEAVNYMEIKYYSVDDKVIEAVFNVFDHSQVISRMLDITDEYKLNYFMYRIYGYDQQKKLSISLDLLPAEKQDKLSIYIKWSEFTQLKDELIKEFTTAYKEFNNAYHGTNNYNEIKIKHQELEKINNELQDLKIQLDSACKDFNNFFFEVYEEDYNDVNNKFQESTKRFHEKYSSTVNQQRINISSNNPFARLIGK